MGKNVASLRNGNCLLKISGICNSLKAAERRLADYVLAQPEQAMRLTMEELAAESESSYATIYRFAKRLGFPGYKEFKNSLAHSVGDRGRFEDQLNSLDIDKTTSIETICSDIYEYTSRIIGDCVSILDAGVVDQAVDLLLKARRVCFIGAGTSYISALYAYCKFLRLGINCTHEPSPTFFHMQCTLLTGEDALFAISSSGRTKTVVDAARIASKQGVKVIGLSDFAISPLTRISTINLHTTSRNAGSFMNLDLPLIIGQITLLDILHMCCCARLGGKARRVYSATKQVADMEKY